CRSAPALTHNFTAQNGKQTRTRIQLQHNTHRVIHVYVFYHVSLHVDDSDATGLWTGATHTSREQPRAAKQQAAAATIKCKNKRQGKESDTMACDADEKEGV